jgi:hypothetical protein
MKRVFVTQRLNVFMSKLHISGEHEVCHLFVGIRHDEDRPMVTVQAVVWPGYAATFGAPFVDWLETTSEYRRMGFATELLKGLESHYGTELITGAGSEDGEKFLSSTCTETEDTPNA